MVHGGYEFLKIDKGKLIPTNFNDFIQCSTYPGIC